MTNQTTPHKDHKAERTLVVIKPDGVQRALIGEIISRYERTGLKLVGIKMLVPTRAFVEKHYTTDPEWCRKTGEKIMKSFADQGQVPPNETATELGAQVLHKLAVYLTSGPVVAMVWQGAHAVAMGRKITGGTEPLSSPVGTVRGDFMFDSYELSRSIDRPIRNLVHASGTIEEAAIEIPHWFLDAELVTYKHLHDQVNYDKDIVGIF